MIFTLFWIAYEGWQVDHNPELGDLMIKLLDAAEAAPKLSGIN